MNKEKTDWKIDKPANVSKGVRRVETAYVAVERFARHPANAIANPNDKKRHPNESRLWMIPTYKRTVVRKSTKGKKDGVPRKEISDSKKATEVKNPLG
jgi:hypothetical protein